MTSGATVRAEDREPLALIPPGIIRVRKQWPPGYVVRHPRGLEPRARPGRGELFAVQHRSSTRPLPASVRCFMDAGRVESPAADRNLSPRQVFRHRPTMDAVQRG